MKSKCCNAYAYCTEEVTEADDGEPYVEDFWICSECQKKCDVTEVKEDDAK